jgi:YD repeat-containing protein
LIYRRFILGIICTLFLASAVFADTANYSYDDAGRLARAVTSTGLVYQYQYDAVGNLLSISQSQISNNPPVLQSIKPDVLFIGSTTLVTITGQNLFSTNGITSNNPSLSAKILTASEIEVKAKITVAPDALPGPVLLTVSTAYGSAGIQTMLISSGLSFDPDVMALSPGTTAISSQLFHPLWKGM